MKKETKPVSSAVRGRGTSRNATGRFEKVKIEPDFNEAGGSEEDIERPRRTEFYKDHTRTIIAQNNSPDIPFRFSINPYRGCEHGCVYCYARPTHEYLGLSAGLDFESKIFVKEEAPQLLREKLTSKSWKPEVISISGVTDCYQPAERRFQLTRRCLEVLAEFKNPAGIVTKNHLVTRDLDILSAMAADRLIAVFLSVTTLDAELARVLEPRTSSPRARLQAISDLSQAGVPVGVNVAPVIPGLTDHEMPAILKAAAEAGARFAGYVPLRLPFSVKDLFLDWLDLHRPERKAKVVSSIRDLRDGDLNSAQFKDRMTGQGPRAENIANMFKIFSQKYGFDRESLRLETRHFRRPTDQLSLF